MKHLCCCNVIFKWIAEDGISADISPHAPNTARTSINVTKIATVNSRK